MDVYGFMNRKGILFGGAIRLHFVIDSSVSWNCFNGGFPTMVIEATCCFIYFSQFLGLWISICAAVHRTRVPMGCVAQGSCRP